MFDLAEFDLDGVKLITPKRFCDQRGFFTVPYNETAFERIGIFNKFIQDNHSRSNTNVFRGLHYQRDYPQAKLVRCIRGTVIDYLVDIRPGSKTFGQGLSLEISDSNNAMLFIPKGYAHGFFVKEGPADFLYKVDNVYDPDGAYTLRWDDPDLGIKLPAKPILSAQDSAGHTLQELKDKGVLPN